MSWSVALSEGSTGGARSAPGAPWEMQDALDRIRRIGGAALIDTVVDLFHSTVRERIDKLHEAIAAGETARVSRLAHAMKGSAAQVGAEPLHALAAALEKDAPALDDRERTQRVALMERELASTLVLLGQFRTPVDQGE